MVLFNLKSSLTLFFSRDSSVIFILNIRRHSKENYFILYSAGRMMNSLSYKMDRDDIKVIITF